MLHNPDSVDRALESLGRRAWPGATVDPELESKLMREFQPHARAPFLARHRVLVPLVAILLLGSAAFAAAGGIRLIRSLFVTTRVNGQVVDTSEVILDENGRGSFTVPIEPTDDLQTLELSLEGEYVGPDGTPGEAGTVTINATAEAGTSEIGVELQVEENSDQESKNEGE